MQWRTTKKIGSGGFGVVYGARRRGDPTRYALKRLLPSNAKEPELVRRFKREIRTQADLEHPNIVPVIDYDLEADPPWFVMPYASANLGDEVGGLETAEALELFDEILDAVEHCHEQDIVHRDLKPANILMFGATPCISDFGLVKNLSRTSSLKTRAAAFAGSRPYAAPEQMEELRVADARADIHALGKILQELITGETPRTLGAAFPRAYRFAVATATARDPDRRFQSVAQLRDAVASAVDSVDRTMPRSDEADELLAGIESAKPKDLAAQVYAFHDFLSTHPEDERLLREFVPKVQLDALKAYGRAYPDEFEQFIVLFDSALPRGSLPFPYCDVVANFAALAYVATGDLVVKQLLLEMLLQVGESHDRNYVAQILMRILCRMEDPSELQMGLRVLKAHPQEVRWAADRGEQVLAELGAARKIVELLKNLK